MLGHLAITKFDRSGSLVYSTYLGGSRSDPPNAMIVDEAGNVYVVGGTDSDDFPITPGAFDTTHSGQFTSDVFVAKLDAEGPQLLYSTFIGGSSSDGAAALFVDASGSAYVTGSTHSHDYSHDTGSLRHRGGSLRRRLRDEARSDRQPARVLDHPSRA